jgi:hypothetical protein
MIGPKLTDLPPVPEFRVGDPRLEKATGTLRAIMVYADMAGGSKCKAIAKLCEETLIELTKDGDQ